MYIPCGLAEKVPSPHAETRSPSALQIVSGCLLRLSTWTSSREFTATPTTDSKLQYLGIALGHGSTTSYLNAPEPTMVMSLYLLRAAGRIVGVGFEPASA